MQVMYTIGKYVLFFLVYSLLGALSETLFRLVTEHHLYSVHGFLHLPLFPIYGFGALLIVRLFRKQVSHPVPLFILGALLCTILEFVANWLLEVIFGNRIWDYSNVPFNLYGRVSLYSSIGFGLGAILLVHFIHPQVEKLIGHLSKRITVFAAAIVLIVLLTDLVSSVIERLPH